MSDNAEFYDAPRVWTANEYITYSGGVDYVLWEANRVNAATSTISGFYPLFEDATIVSFTTSGRVLW